MRLDGALEPRPRYGAAFGTLKGRRFIGVAQYRRETREKCEQKQQQQADEDDEASATASISDAECLTNNNINNNNNNSCDNSKYQNNSNNCPWACISNTNQNKGVSTTTTATRAETTTRVAAPAVEAKVVGEEVGDGDGVEGAPTNWRVISFCCDNVKRALLASLKIRAQQSLMLMAALTGNKQVGGRGRGRGREHGRRHRAKFGLPDGNHWERRLSTFVLSLISVIALLPPLTLGDDGDNFFAVNAFSAGPETTTPEFDYASRGQKKYGDKCDNTLECGFPGSICDPKKKSCQCTEDLPVTNHFDKCGKEAAVNESCFFNEQCEVKYFQTECRDGRCICRFEMSPIWGKDGSVECKGRQDKRGPETYIDPAMIGVLVGMALMFIIICVVLRLFSQARWRENRTIFNTPNPRLMNVSLLRDSKLLHGQERRGSRMSVRAPSRQPSMASLRPHSPNPSLGKTGSHSESHGSASNASATSVRSNRSNSVAPGKVAATHHERHGSSSHRHHHHQQQQQPQSPQEQTLITNITTNPVAESVTVEIIEPGQK
ncbi:uncharacterized protein LOC6649598 isoform X1 [Drosophila willistoni]|uniref:uncharacterized protein LOC6649598 isoform X1 n=1 Tax=Drosophila willistoni TaxID=7260 RepID=UPI001F081084|nr:uncharacterized protein LOC6649598 isoform X1 [Drosophila willistoni]